VPPPVGQGAFMSLDNEASRHWQAVRPALAAKFTKRVEWMIDFTELPADGVKFEQLVREILVRSEFDVHWTGVGPDGGRDLVAIETAQGQLAPFERRWLVSCKHYANSGKSVGLDDVTDISDACASVDATGYLLVCSTQPSSAVVRRLQEIQTNKRIATRYWDSIEIEKRLNAPNTFALVNIFFPKSSAAIPWLIYNTTRPSFWAANYKDYFLYLGSRTANLYPSLQDVEEMVRRLESIELPKGSDWREHFIRPRAVYFDDKHEQYSVFADYIYPRSDERNTLLPGQLNDVLKDGQGLYSDDQVMWKLTHWDIRYVSTDQASDHFHLDHKSYYEPHIDNFRSGSARESFISELSWVHNPDMIALRD
jgi:restriction endonuclease